MDRDSTQDWLLPPGASPPLMAELESRVDEALATARASEVAVMAVGDAALDAAEQARRAAELAERASATALEIRREANGDTVLAERPTARDAGTLPRTETGDARLRIFSERADRVAERLAALGSGSRAWRAASAGEEHPQAGA